MIFAAHEIPCAWQRSSLFGCMRLPSELPLKILIRDVQGPRYTSLGLCCALAQRCCAGSSTTRVYLSCTQEHALVSPDEGPQIPLGRPFCSASHCSFKRVNMMGHDSDSDPRFRTCPAPNEILVTCRLEPVTAAIFTSRCDDPGKCCALSTAPAHVADTTCCSFLTFCFRSVSISHLAPNCPRVLYCR